MGLIRGTLMLGTGGLVSGSSKKQRVAKSQLRELRAQTKLLEQIADPGKLERERAARQAAKEARQARTAAILEARHQRALARKERLATRREDTQIPQRHVANSAPWPIWASKTLRIMGWVWVVFLALLAFSVAAVNIAAAVVAGLLAGGLAWILVSPRTAEAVPASQEPTQ